MSIDLDTPPESVLEFVTERHLATLSTVRADGSLHVVPVGFSYDSAARLVRIITFDGSQKVANADRGGRAAVCQVDGGRWLTFEGTIETVRDPARVQAAVAGYAARYGQPGERDTRVALEIAVDRILGRA